MLPSSSSFDGAVRLEQLCTEDAALNSEPKPLRTSSSYELLYMATRPLRQAALRARQRNAHYFEVPKCIRRPYILTYYRTNYDLYSCLRSFVELHNESLNVWSHVMGVIIFIAIGHHVASAGLPPTAAALERWPLYVFIASALYCLSASAIYHLIGTANVRWHDRLMSWDYVGIVGLIVGSATPVAWYSFGGQHHLERSLYLAVITLLGAIVIIGSLNGALGRASDAVRIALFLGLAGSGVMALLHAAVVHDFAPRNVDLIIGVVKMGLTYILGIGFYASKFPESVQPRSFDRFGASHQLWHACVLIAAICHFRTVFTLWRETALLAGSLRSSALAQQQLGQVAAAMPSVAGSVEL